MRSMWKWHGKSVWFMSFVFFPDEPETRDAWWEEIRQEIKSHAKALGCHAVVGYSESTSIWCVLNVSTEYNTFRYCLFFFFTLSLESNVCLIFYIYILFLSTHIKSTFVSFYLIYSILFSSWVHLICPHLTNSHLAYSRLPSFHQLSPYDVSDVLCKLIFYVQVGAVVLL